MKVMFIDDTESEVRGLIDTAKEKNWNCQLYGFDKWLKNIESFDPDIIVLDWKEEMNQEAGKRIFDSVWKYRFRPIIVYSAYADIIDFDEEITSCSLVKIIKKGDPDPVIKYLEEIMPVVPSITDLRGRMNNALKKSIDVLPTILTDRIEDKGIIDYMFSKRTSRFFDENYSGSPMPPWVQYICPPIDKQLLVGDILRVYTPIEDMNAIGHPNEYRVILSPSCDMRPGKVSRVLIAQCENAKLVSCKTQVKDPKKLEACIEEVKHILNQGYINAKVPLPLMPDKIPAMTINLKELDFVPIEEIALSLKEIGEGKKFFRVASIDSPFRERVVWAHMINSCRPGVNDLDCNRWVEHIFYESI